MASYTSQLLTWKPWTTCTVTFPSSPREINWMESDKYTQVLWTLRNTSESWAKENERQNTHVTGSGKCPRKPSQNSRDTHQWLFHCSASLKLRNCQWFNVPSMPFSHLQSIKLMDSSARQETCSNSMEAKRLNLRGVKSDHGDLVENFTGTERVGIGAVLK